MANAAAARFVPAEKTKQKQNDKIQMNGPANAALLFFFPPYVMKKHDKHP
jgi:hypothetical protein